MATQLVTAVVTASVTFYLVRALGPTDFGLFSLAAGMAGILLVPADFGVASAAARFVAERLGDRGAAARILATALSLRLLIAGSVAVALLVAAAPIANLYGEPDLAWPLRGVALALFGQSVMALYAAAFLAVRRISTNLRIVTSESAVEGIATVGLVLAGGGAAGAAFGRAVGYCAGAAVAIAFAIRYFSHSVVDLRNTASRMAPIARYGSALLIVDGAFALYSQIDVLIIGAYLGSASVGVFSAALRITTVLHYAGLAVSNSVSPRVARHGEQDPDVRAFEGALRCLLLLQGALAAGVLMWAGPMVDLVLGSQYAESAAVLRWLVPYVFLQGVAPLLSVSVNYLGAARRRIPIALLALAVSVALNLVLVPRIGVVGGAIGTSVAYALYVPAHFLLCVRLLGLDPRPLLLTLARVVGAAGVMAIALAGFGTTALSATDWIVGGLAGLLLYAAALVLSREVTLADVRGAASAVRGSRTRR